ncbi:MAG: [citrate (pro-3S)-lyase] ligase [Desulfovibrio sp.]|jgi:[citrate (pro-3S)-lyase] ligase|nr:[citrate (pro-3S)-lyase] ligase [Desulfovibrio sp.]
MSDSFALREVYPRSERERRTLGDFLERHGLRYEEDIEYAVGAYDENDALIACGCCSGRVLKCFAVNEEARGRNLLGSILSRLSTWQFQRGNTRLLVFTKPENGVFFQQSGFFVVAATPRAMLLENLNNGFSRFAEKSLSPGDAHTPSGAVVMNCNPFTLGHRHLIEYAAARCPVLHIFLVEEDRSIFPFHVRKRLLREGTADIPNVRIHDSGPYMISAATFPTYFLKSVDEATDVCAELDITIFACGIAPPFSIRRRFAGEEPYCELTEKYNAAMRRILPDYGIALEIIPRLRAGGHTVSASIVRKILRESGPCASLHCLVPESTRLFLEGEEAAAILAKLRNNGDARCEPFLSAETAAQDNQGGKMHVGAEKKRYCRDAGIQRYSSHHCSQSRQGD